LSAATVSRIHNIIDQALDHAVETRLISWNPDNATKRPAVKNKKGEAMPDKSLDKFLFVLRAFKDIKQKPRNRLRGLLFNMERKKGFEPSTLALASAGRLFQPASSSPIMA